MSASPPIISIITVTYNSAATIADTLQSVAEQDYPYIEHIVIDGASKDNTLAIAKQYNHVAKIVSERDKGIYDAMNKGIALASGEWIGILNSDDVFATPQTISSVVSFIQQHPDVAAVYGNIVYFRTENPAKVVRYWKTKPYYPAFFEHGNVPPHPALFVSKKVYTEIGLYYPDFKICSDYEFMFRMMKVHGYKSRFLDQTIVRMRLGGISTEGLHSYWTTTKELKSAWNMNGFAYPMALYVIRPVKKILQLLLK